MDASLEVPIQARPHLLVHHLLQEALVVHVSAVLVENTVESYHALARYELEKVVAYQAHARLEAGKNVASQECGGHEMVNISPRPQQLALNLREGEAAKK